MSLLLKTIRQFKIVKNTIKYFKFVNIKTKTENKFEQLEKSKLYNYTPRIFFNEVIK